ncbi:hypothetical protein [Candidatus Amarolinea dominans]|uniref:hypothetical protein n=1 Tax=Candidatus Amarolinea dominans TaxID=3140696 RepID=UPI0031351799|nr:hypothetical protein [Anaerolineae bacterium]
MDISEITIFYPDLLRPCAPQRRLVGVGRGVSNGTRYACAAAVLRLDSPQLAATLRAHRRPAGRACSKLIAWYAAAQR